MTIRLFPLDPSEPAHYLNSRLDFSKPLAQTLQEALTKTAQHYNTAVWVDSHLVAQYVFEYRRMTQGSRPFKGASLHARPDGTVVKVSDPRANFSQTVDYVQHLFRESYHGCRYAHEHRYIVHPEAVCGPQCRAHKRRLMAMLMQRARAVCPACFMIANLDGRCPTCEQVVPDKPVTMSHPRVSVYSRKED